MREGSEYVRLDSKDGICISIEGLRKHKWLRDIARGFIGDPTGHKNEASLRQGLKMLDGMDQQRIPSALCGLCEKEIYPDDETCQDEDGAFVHLNCDIAESGDFE